MRPPKYMAKVMELAATLGLDPGVLEIEVLHDEWCAIMRGGRHCDCEPDVRVRDTHRGPRS